MKKIRINNPLYYFPQSTLLILLLLLIFVTINIFEVNLYANILPLMIILLLFIYNFYMYKHNNYIAYDDNYLYISRYFYKETNKFTFHFFNNVKVMKTIRKDTIKINDIKLIKLENNNEEINTKFYKTREICIITNNNKIRLNIIYYKKNTLKKIFQNFPTDDKLKEYLK